MATTQQCRVTPPLQVSPTLCVLPQGVQRERLAHVSCLQGVVGYTASDADRLRNMLLAHGGAYSVSVFPQWRLRCKALIAARTAASGAVYFCSLAQQFFNEASVVTAQRGVYLCVVAWLSAEERRKLNGKFCDTQNRKTEDRERYSAQ